MFPITAADVYDKTTRKADHNLTERTSVKADLQRHRLHMATLPRYLRITEDTTAVASEHYGSSIRKTHETV